MEKDMNKPRRSLFEELNSLAMAIEPERFVEQKGEHIISGALNLIEFIQREFDEEVATDLTKRFINSIRTGDMRKFKRGITHAKKKDDI
tara:strand:+ start:170 stop:436 length:267 start_codon:yes stop_codon:yes gene_type:complete